MSADSELVICVDWRLRCSIEALEFGEFFRHRSLARDETGAIVSRCKVSFS